MTKQLTKGNLPLPRANGTQRDLHVFFVLVFLISFLLIANFFEYFPNGWDQTEYARGLQQNYLPHSPYILYFLLGKIFFWLIGDPAVALSALSTACALLSLALFYRINSRFYHDSQPPLFVPTAALFATLFMGTNYLFVRQAGTQEIYIVQLCFLLLCVALILNHKRKGTLLAGLAYGCAIAIHNASFFVLPALLFLLLTEQGKIGRRKRLLQFIAAAMGTVFLFSVIIYLLFPKDYANHLFFFFDYLQGIAPTGKLTHLFEPLFLQESAQELIYRLSSQDIPHGRMPLATFPLGLSGGHLLLTLVGFVLLRRLKRGTAVFWLLWSLPYLGYEILLGNTPDFGAYVVFIIPVVMVILGTLSTWIFTKIWQAKRRRLPLAVLFILLLFSLLLLPSGRLFRQHWHTVAQDAVLQYSKVRLAALATEDKLPTNAVVIQAIEEWNVNALPYYSPYRPVVRDGGYLLLYNGQGPFTPMTYAYYQILTTEKLTELLAANVPVYAFEPDPLQNFAKEMIDPEAFQWDEAITLDLGRAKSQIMLPSALQSQLPDCLFTLYRASPAQ